MSRANVKYWTKTISNQTLVSAEARIEQYFNKSIIDKSSEWVCAVERFSLNLNGIPAYENVNTDQLTLFDNNTAGANSIVVDLPDSATTLPDFIFKINASLATNGTNVRFRMDREGYLRFDGGDMSTHDLSVIFTREELHVLFDIHPDQREVLNTIKSRTPRLDTFDQVKYIQLTTNLPLVSDSLGQIRTNVLTDFVPLNPMSVSVLQHHIQQDQLANTSFSYPPRQRLIYTPKVRRFLNLNSDVPLVHITVDANFIDQAGEAQPVILPPGCEFSIKLGFHLKQ